MGRMGYGCEEYERFWIIVSMRCNGRGEHGIDNWYGILDVKGMDDGKVMK